MFICLHAPCGYGFPLGTLAPPPTQSKDMQVRLIGDSKLAVGVNGCLSSCISPVMDWQPVQGVLHLSPYYS